MTIVQDLQQDIVAGLLGAQAADGGWSTVGGGPPDTESTAWAAMALADRTGGASRAALSGRDWLIRQQRPDGAWPVWPSVPVSGWTTSLAVLSLAGAEDGAATAGGEWLLGSRARRASAATSRSMSRPAAFLPGEKSRGAAETDACSRWAVPKASLT